MFDKILVGVDGSENALRAAKTAADLARELQARLFVVVAFEPIPDYLGEPFWEETVAARLGKAQQILQQALEAAGDVPKGVETEVLEGRPAEAILEVADTRQVDMIVVGARGQGGLASLLLGSQSHKIISHAKCPVLLVK